MSRRAPVQLACGRSTSGQYEILQDTTDRVLRSNVGNIYRFLEKVTPQVQLFSDEEEPYYRLIDLWDALNEPYGFEVPLKVCETYKEEEVDAFYTPHLSGLQIYLPAQSEHSTTEGQKLFFEWYSSDPPDSRLPIMDQIESIAHECPLINDPETRSSKLGSNSWISIMWLPILCHNLTANRVRGQFLTYHLLRPPPNKVHQFWSSTFTFASATPIEGNTVATQTPETKANSASTQTDIKGRLRTPSDGGRSHSVPPPERSQLESFLPQKKEDHSDASDPKLNELGSKPSSTASSPLQPTYLRAIDQPFLSVEKVPSNYSKSNGSHSPYSVSSDPNMLTFDNYDTPSVSPFMSDDGSHASSPVMSASCSPTNPPVIDSTRKGYVVLVGFIPYKIRFDTWFSHMPLLEGMELYQAPLWLMDASNKLIKSAKCQHPDFYHFLTNMPVLNRLLEEFQK